MASNGLTRSGGLRSLCVCWLPWLLATIAQVEPVIAGEVRALQPRGKALLARGIQRSPTFRDLVDKIIQSDLVVYVDLDPFIERRFYGVVRFVGTAAGTRYLNVWLRPQRIDDEIVGTLGHELQHAVEMAHAREVTDEASFTAFWILKGQRGREGTLDTRPARDVAERVRAELRNRHVALVTDSATRTRAAAETRLSASCTRACGG